MINYPQIYTHFKLFLFRNYADFLKKIPTKVYDKLRLTLPKIVVESTKIISEVKSFEVKTKLSNSGLYYL